jgi:hypothetical protein
MVGPSNRHSPVPIWQSSIELRGAVVEASFAQSDPPLLRRLSGRRAMKEPQPLIAPLADLPLAGIYVQPLRLIPTRDSIEKLVLYVRLLERLEALGLPVIAGRVGAFGLVLEAAGVGLFDSGLGETEAFDLASLTRPRRQTNEGDPGPKGDRRVHRQLIEARDSAAVVTRTLSERELEVPNFDHLERWLGVLSRRTERQDKAA